VPDSGYWLSARGQTAEARVRYCYVPRDENAGEIRQISAPELKAMLDAGVPCELVDVRTPEERAIATIEGARLLDRAYHDALITLDRDTPLVFQCHHGIRSQQAAQYFQERGFRRLYNLAGGIDAWSMLVDPSVPRY
jgi:rhodanese-related sulfurtransferase